MINFFALFESALMAKPYLRLEIGYTKMTDWMVLVTDVSGGGKRRIVEVQESNHGIALAKAYVLFAHFLSEECDEY